MGVASSQLQTMAKTTNKQEVGVLRKAASKQQSEPKKKKTQLGLFKEFTLHKYKFKGLFFLLAGEHAKMQRSR